MGNPKGSRFHPQTLTSFSVILLHRNPLRCLRKKWLKKSSRMLTELKPKLVTVVPQNLQHTLTDTPSPNTVTVTPVMDTSPSHLTIPACTIINPIRPKQ